MLSYFWLCIIFTTQLLYLDLIAYLHFWFCCSSYCRFKCFMLSFPWLFHKPVLVLHAFIFMTLYTFHAPLATSTPHPLLALFILLLFILHTQCTFYTFHTFPATRTKFNANLHLQCCSPGVNHHSTFITFVTWSIFFGQFLPKKNTKPRLSTVTL